MKEIGAYFGLHQSRISKIIRAAPGWGMSQDLTLASPQAPMLFLNFNHKYSN